MRLLYGEYELSLDGKNRMLVPSEVRRCFDPAQDGEAFFLVVGVNRVPWLYPEKYYEGLALREQPEMTPEEDRIAYDHLNFALATRLEWDAQGRILISEKILRRTGTGREVTLVGSRDHLELFNRVDWEARRESLIARAAEIAVRSRQTRRDP